MVAYLSTQWEMSVIIGREGCRGREGVGSGGASIVTSDISTNSNPNTFFATFGASVAAGLNGPTLLRGVMPVLRPDASSTHPSFAAAAASRSRPEPLPGVGVKVGSSARASMPMVLVPA